MSLLEDSATKHAATLEIRLQKGSKYGMMLFGKELVKQHSKAILGTTKSGKLYKYKGRNIRASAENEYPANRSGKLRKGTTFQVLGSDKMFFGNKVDYAKYVEDGNSRGLKGRKNHLKILRANAAKGRSLIETVTLRFLKAKK